LIGVILAVLGTSYVFKDVLSAGFRPYIERGNSVRGEATERLYAMTIGSFMNVLEQNGILGAGAGIGSQGAQHFGIDLANAEITGVSSEGGFGKVLAELGLPGLIVFLWVMVRTAIYIWNMMAAIPRDDSARSRLAYGLISFLLANGVVFATAHQVFGDPFVLLILGWILGFVFAIPKFSEPQGATQHAGIVLTGTPMPIPGFSALSSFVKRVRW
ncbi:MAG TPA: hypothetical protein VEJ88_06630, partial [Dissulfurispiraceae bacterium]|nr:hypothetical protein [Dissulfurispiraceae bacterium]